jgi:hypothetical protein
MDLALSRSGRRRGPLSGRGLGIFSARAVRQAMQIVRWFSPLGAGTQSGLTPANARPIGHLATQIAAVGAGIYGLLADQGDYAVTGSGQLVNLTAGGTPNGGVYIRGVNADGTPAKAKLVGERTAFTEPADPETVTDTRAWTPGLKECFRFNSGVSWVNIQHLRFEHIGGVTDAVGVNAGVGSAIWLSAGTSTGCSFSDLEGLNVRSLISGNAGASWVDMSVRNVSVVGFSKACIRIRGNSLRISITASALNSARQDGDNFALGIQLEENASYVYIDGCTVKNCHDTVNAYANGDGLSAEATTSFLEVRNCTFEGHTDGGCDLKTASGTVLVEDCVFRGNKRNIRVWQRPDGTPMVFNRILSDAPVQRAGSSGNPCHIFLTGGATSGDPGALVEFNEPILTGAATQLVGGAAAGRRVTIEGHNATATLIDALVDAAAAAGGDSNNQPTTSEVVEIDIPPTPPSGFALLVGADGLYLRGADGAFLFAPV